MLKNNGDNPEHSFGHGKKTLARVFLTLNLLALACHTAARLAMLAWARGGYRLRRDIPLLPEPAHHRACGPQTTVTR